MIPNLRCARCRTDKCWGGGHCQRRTAEPDCAQGRHPSTLSGPAKCTPLSGSCGSCSQGHSLALGARRMPRYAPWRDATRPSWTARALARIRPCRRNRIDGAGAFALCCGAGSGGSCPRRGRPRPGHDDAPAAAVRATGAAARGSPAGHAAPAARHAASGDAAAGHAAAAAWK